MTRATNAPATRRRRKRILKQAEGFFGFKHKSPTKAKEQLMHSWTYAYRDRKRRKRNFAKLWNVRINNSVHEHGLNYSRFKRLLTLAQIKLNRKQLAKMPINEPEQFNKLIEKVKNPW